MGNLFDIVGVVVLGWFGFTGLRAGFIESAMKLIGAMGAIYCMLNYNTQVAQFLGRLFNLAPKYQTVVSFAVIFLVVLYAFHALASILRKTIRLLLLGWVDRLGGLLFGLVKATVILSAVIWVIDFMPREWTHDWEQQSRLAPLVITFQGTLVDIFSLEDELELIQETADKLKSRLPQNPLPKLPSQFPTQRK